MRHLILVLLCALPSNEADAQKPFDALLARTARLLDQGQFRQAKMAAWQLTNIVAQAPGTDSFQVAQVLFLTGRCCQAAAKTDSAVLLYRSSLAVLPKTQPESAALEAHIGSFLGQHLTKPADTAEARRLLSNSIEFFQKEPYRRTAEAAYSYLALASWHYRKRNFAEAKSANEQALNISSAWPNGEHPDLCAKILNVQGELCRQYQEFEAAVRHLESAERFFLLTGGADNDNLAGTYTNIGACYVAMGLPRKGIVCYEKALAAFRRQDERHPTLAVVFNNLGNASKEIGEHAAAVRYLKEAIGFNTNRAGVYSTNLGDVYLEMDSLLLAKQCFQTAIQRLTPFAAQLADDLARPHHNLALLYLREKNTDKALEHEQKSLPLRRSKWGFYHLDVARSYLGLSSIYAEKKDGRQSGLYADTALLIQRSIVPSGPHPEIAQTHLFKANLAFDAADFTATETALDSALAAVGYRSADHFADVTSPLEMLEAFARKTDLATARYQRTLSPQHLADARDFSKIAIAALLNWRDGLAEEVSKTAALQRNYSVFGKAIRAALLSLDQAEDGDDIKATVFAYAEQSKALVLLDAMQNSKAKQFAGIPDSVTRRERNLRQAITDTEKQRQLLTTGAKPTIDSVAAQLNTHLLQLHRDYAAFGKSLESAYPAYYRLKHDRATADLPTAQRLLAPGHTLLEYFTGDSSIYAFVVRPDRYQVTEIKRDFPLETLVQQMRNGLSGFYAQKNPHDTLYEHTLRQYIATACSLYTRLIAPIEAQLTDDTLIIVPDGVLGYLPFEALLSSPPADSGNFGTYPFWLRKKQISYCYSATLLREMKQKQHKTPPIGSLLAFAPCYKGNEAGLRKQFGSKPKPRPAASAQPKNSIAARGGFEPLPASGEEAYRVSEAWRGRRFVHREGTLARFEQLAADYRILHLSTHGQANSQAGDNSYLVFAAGPTDSAEYELLYVRDLYNFQLNADLVTLSACETGIGELQRGEGVVSLARAFAYAGAKSIVTSLWATNDGATKELMEKFYEALRQPGRSKDAALRAAKLRYLSDFPGEQAHPFFWAAFVPIGDMAPIRER